MSTMSHHIVRSKRDFQFPRQRYCDVASGRSNLIYQNSLLLLFIAFNVVVAPNIVSDTIRSFEDRVCGLLSSTQTSKITINDGKQVTLNVPRETNSVSASHTSTPW